MSDRILCRDQVRAVDRVAIEQWGIPGILLMENAGRGVADVMDRLGISGPVVIACAKGNNGGDGLVLARHLHLRGRQAVVLLVGAPDDLSGDAAWNLSLLRRTSVPVEVDVSVDDAIVKQHLDSADWVVDALLGTGAQGEPRPPIGPWIELLNVTSCKKLAMDVPSGLDAQTGVPATTTFRADHTCTFVAHKAGFVNPLARPFLGDVHLLDIGLPWETVEAALAQANDSHES